jgi:hypothetical protein
MRDAFAASTKFTVVRAEKLAAELDGHVASK